MVSTCLVSPDRRTDIWKPLRAGGPWACADLQVDHDRQSRARRYADDRRLPPIPSRPVRASLFPFPSSSDLLQLCWGPSPNALCYGEFAIRRSCRCFWRRSGSLSSVFKGTGRMIWGGRAAYSLSTLGEHRANCLWRHAYYAQQFIVLGAAILIMIVFGVFLQEFCTTAEIGFKPRPTTKRLRGSSEFQWNTYLCVQFGVGAALAGAHSRAHGSNYPASLTSDCFCFSRPSPQPFLEV